MINSGKTHRHICPRNCYSNCGIISHIKNGKLKKISGDTSHPFTKGKLCAKGFSYLELVYSNERITHPLKQIPRGSGNWKKISWNEALSIISEKILKIREEYGSNLPVMYCKFSGNLGILHLALDGFFNSIGPVTLPGGSLCNSTGMDSFLYTFGELPYTDPEDMKNSKFILIWGGNPVWTCGHQMMYINEARKKGAKVAVIDPIYSATAALADYYYQINPGTDGIFALALCKYIINNGWYNRNFVDKYVSGFDKFVTYLEEEVSYEFASKETGLSQKAIEELAYNYVKTAPASIWLGAGVQRHVNSGQNLRAICSLAAISGNIGKEGSSIYYFHYSTNCFTSKILQNSQGLHHRYVPLYALGKKMAKLYPPVEMAFIAGANPLNQYPAQSDLEKALENVDLIVTADMFLNRSAYKSDLFLPTTTIFEHEDLVYSYWHHWVGFSEKAIEPVGSSLSDLEIAIEISKKMNELQKGSCSFPIDKKTEDFIYEEIDSNTLKSLGIKNKGEIKKGYHRVNLPPITWSDYTFPTPSGKIELFSEEAQKKSLPGLPEYVPPAKGSVYPYRLMTNHHINGINSQFLNCGWLREISEPVLYINPSTAQKLNLKTGNTVIVYNRYGEMKIKVRIVPLVPEKTVLCYQGNEYTSQPVNSLIPPLPTDMGDKSSGFKGIAYYDTFVNILKPE